MFGPTSSPKSDVPLHMHLLKNKLFVIAITCLVFISCSKEDSFEAETPKYNIDITLAHKNDANMSNRILSIINNHRDSLGLPVLNADTEYASALAVEHTEYMISQNQISHDNFHYRSDAIKYIGNAQRVGENVGFGYKTAEEAVNAWFNSSGHKAIIEGDYTHTGFGVMQSNNGQNFFTQIFYKK